MEAKILRLLALLLILLALPMDALAWGVGVHLTLGARLLASPEALPAALQALLASLRAETA